MPAVAQRARRAGRTAGRALRLTLAVAIDAGDGAALPPDRFGIVVAGSNLQQDGSWRAFEKFRVQPAYLSPRYGYEFYDTHVMATIAEVLGARGPGLTVGGASASGNVAIATALDLLRAGRADACLVVGPLPDLSPAEWQALGAMGALAGADPALCRPFDRAAAGFVPGEACGALLLETVASAAARGAGPLAEIVGACFVMGGSQLPGPDLESEVRAMAGALADAGVALEAIDAISAHATGTPAGDAAECAAIRRFLGDRCGAVPVNATKSLIGHALHAAGVVEAIALILQLRGGFIHGTAGLVDPIDRDLWLVGPQGQDQPLRLGLSNAFGFGSIATSVLVRAAEDER
jgi:malonyl-ACP decarboxylase